MMEKLYEDFITKVLPQIKEGLIITKDYFVDLFGRYVKYLIAVDSIEMLIGFIFLVGALYFGLRKKTRDWLTETNSYGDYKEEARWAILFPLIVFFIVGIVLFFNGGFHLIKDLYIPEVRIYQQLKPQVVSE